MNRLALHASVAAHLSIPDLVSATAEAGFDSIGLRVAGAAESQGRWDKGAGSAELRQAVDRLLATRVSVLDIGRAELRAGSDRKQADAHARVVEFGVRLGAHWATAAAVETSAAAAEIADQFERFAVRCKDNQLIPLLVPQPGTAVDTPAAALGIARQAGGGIVVEVALPADPVAIDDIAMDAGTALGYLRLHAEDLDAVADDEDRYAGVFATVPVHVPIAVGTLEHREPQPATELVAQARRWRRVIDLMLEHPRARAARMTATTAGAPAAGAQPDRESSGS